MEFIPNRGRGEDDQFPLLKVEGGDGDGVEPPASVDQLESRVVAPKRRTCLCSRPEFILVCWITLVLFLIGLIAYILACSSLNEDNIRKARQSKCLADDRTQVIAYQIFDKGHKIRFRQYSEFLAMIAGKYPHLCFNICFLEDDSKQSVQGSQQSRLYKLFGISDLHALNKLLIEHHNINVTVAPLSCYMENTLLKNQWRAVPVSYLPLYLRANAVWKNGGIALDLAKYSNKYYFQRLDSRISNVFKQLNDDESFRLNFEEDTMTFSFLLNGILSQLWNNTRALFNKTHVHSNTEKAHDSNVPVIRTHRNKRNANQKVDEMNIETPLKVPKSDETLAPSNETTLNSLIDIIDIAVPHENNKYGTAKPKESNFTVQDKKMLEESKFATNISNATRHVPPAIFIYEITMFPHRPKAEGGVIQIEGDNLYDPYPNTLTIDMEGEFVACGSYQHPFLAEVLLSDYPRIKLDVKLIFRFIYEIMCSGRLVNDYCETVRFI